MKERSQIRPWPPPTFWAKLGAVDSVRVDKWLWAARMFKTRSAASKACSAGHVKIEGDSVKSSKMVRAGDQIDVLAPGGRRVLDVVALADRRGSAPVAPALYDAQTPEPPPEMKYVQPPGGRRDRGAGRPTKYERRKISKLRTGEDE